MSKKPTNAELTAEVARLTALLEGFANSAKSITTTDTEAGLTRYNMAGIKAKSMSYTPSAVDAIRLFTWPAMAKGVEKKEIIALLISQGFNPATVRARVKRIHDGTDESCYSEEIRARLGLDEDEEAEIDNDEALEAQADADAEAQEEGEDEE